MTKPLPPPPSHPTLSPAVSVTGETAVTIDGLGGEPSLEARACVPPEASRLVVLCHPHPLYGGTMHSAVIVALAKVLEQRREGGVGWIRFNYRGVGASGGGYRDGHGEILDVRAVIQDARRRAPSAALSVCGYSFGTWVGMRAAALEEDVERVALIAPAVRIFRFVRADAARYQGRLSMYVGDRDDFCSVAEARALASELGATLDVFADSDHFFLRGRRKLAEGVVPFLAP